MADRPRISVIIATSNNADHIEECLDCVLTQSLNEIEVIVVDVCSTDETKEILEEIAKTDERLVYLVDSMGRVLLEIDNWKEGRGKREYSDFYLQKISENIRRTIEDPKNHRREKELLDELEEIERYRRGEVDEKYITDYWNQYTRAIS